MRSEKPEEREGLFKVLERGSVVSDPQRPHGLQPTRLFCPWIFQARVLEWGAIAFSDHILLVRNKFQVSPILKGKALFKIMHTG